MSVELHATGSSTHGDVYVPVTTHRIFAEQWLPVCDRMNLQIVPMLGNPGVVVTSSDPSEITVGVEVLRDELRRVIAAARAVPSGIVAEGAERLLDALQTAERLGHTRVTIGG